MNIKNLSLISACVSTMIASSTYAVEIVNDDFSTENLTLATTDAGYFGASADSAIEENVDANGNLESIGLVTGSSGRTLKIDFPAQTLATDGDSLTTSVTFVTPSTVGPNDDMRIGLFNRLGRPGLDGQTSFSSSNQNIDYVGLPGLYTELDIDSSSSQDIDMRPSEPSRTGRHSSISLGFDSSFPDPDLSYSFFPNTTYNFIYLIERNADDLTVTATFNLVNAAGAITQLGENSITLDGGFTAIEDPDPAVDFDFNREEDQIDPETGEEVEVEIEGTVLAEIDDSYTIDMFSIGASGGAFGVSPDANIANNGIDIISFSVDFEGAGAIDPPSDDEETCYVTGTETDQTAAVFCL